MSDGTRLAQTLRRLATFIEPFEYLSPWDDIIRSLYEAHHNWPSLVHPPRRLQRDEDGHHWIYALAVGHGPRHEIVNFPHGGELWRAAGAIDHIAFLCLNPWLLVDRTITFVLDAPAAMSRNLRRWAADSTLDAEFIAQSILAHWRESNPDYDPAWTYPVTIRGRHYGHPAPGTLANIQIMEEIAATSGAMLTGLEPGHNKFIGVGTHIYFSGPPGDQTSRTIRRLEQPAGHLNLVLDEGPPEDPHQTRYAGAKATYDFDHLATRLGYDPNVEVAGTIYDYALQQGVLSQPVQPFALATEVPMLAYQPLPMHVTRRRALGSYRRRIALLYRLLEQAGDIAMLLPSDPDVRTVSGIGQYLQKWGRRGHEPGPLDEIVHPHELARHGVLNAVNVMRRGAPAIAVLRRHRHRLERLGPSQVQVFEDIERTNQVLAIMLVPRLSVVPPHLAITLQIMNFELASAGSRGISPDAPL